MTRAAPVLVVVLALAVLAGSASAAFPGRNGLIAYTEECCLGSDGTEFSTRLVAPDGSRARRVDGSDRVSFSPDGRRLLFGDAFGFGLFITGLDAQDRRRRISRKEDYDAEWSPTGRRIVLVRNGMLRIRGGGRGKALIAGGEPAWSVRGEIAFTTEDGIYVIRPDGSGLRFLVAGSQPDWAPNGRRVTFAGPSRSVWTVRANGTGKRRLRPGHSPSFSPDGRKIVYMGSGGLVRIMGADGKRSRKLPYRGNFLDGDTIFARPDWQPLPRSRR